MERVPDPEDDGAVPVVPARPRLRAVDLAQGGGGAMSRRSGGGERVRVRAAGAVDGAFDEFFTTTWGRTVGSVYVLLGNLAEAEDVVQEAYTRAARHWDRLSEYEDPEGWVRRVAWNLALSTLRRARRRAVALLGGVDVAPEPQNASDRVIDLHRALRGLPMRYRAVLTLHYLLDMSVREVADELGLPPETVKSQLARGRRRLAEALEDAVPFVDDEGVA